MKSAPQKQLQYLVDMIFQRVRRVELLLASLAVGAWVSRELFDQNRPSQPSVARMAWVVSLEEKCMLGML